MTPDQWQKVEAVFHRASELSGADRLAYLDHACGDDAALRMEVESLLAADDAGGSLVEAAIADEAGLLAAQQKRSVIGQYIGPYRILDEIGTGGMGAVYLAIRDDDPFAKQVAVKVIRLGMDTEYILGRFSKERQILARLDHPHIARLLESGVSDQGRPYFAMEYVPGVPITQYCEKRDLSIDARLRLFQRVCSAVEYAHQKLTVHRDLKPTNILVTEAGLPKLLDFGIAKLLIDEAASGASRAMTATLTMMRMMTPDYASPEQVKGEPSTTATDVYSLGVILYELIAGRRPFQFASPAPGEILRVITGTEADRPSVALMRNRVMPERMRIARARQVEGDLDSIVAMAIRPEPGMRYPSVAQLAADIQRFLDGKPVRARQGTIGYLTGKFVRRHRIAVVAGALASASLVFGAVASTEQARRAERRFGEIRKLAHHFVFDFHDRLEPLPGSVAARELMVKTALDYLDRLRSESRDDPSLELELAMAYQKVADVQGNPHAPNLGLTSAALESYRKSVTLLEDLAGRSYSVLTPAPAVPDQLVRLLIESYFKTGDLLHQSGSSDEALVLFAKGLALARSLPAGSDAQRLAGMGLQRIGGSQLRRGRLREAAASHNEALKLFEQWEQTHSGAEARRLISNTYSDLGVVLIEMGDVSRAIENFQNSMAIREQLLQKHPANVLFRRDLMSAYLSVGDALGGTAYFNLGESKAALEYYRKALDLASQLASHDQKNALALRDLSNAERKFANLLRDTDPQRAAAGYRRAGALADRLLQLDPGNAEWFRLKALTEMSLGYALSRSGDRAGAVRAIEAAISTQQNLITKDNARTAPRQDMLAALNYLGDAWLGAGQHDKALQAYQRAVTIGEELYNRNRADLYSLFCLATSYERLADFHAVTARRTSSSASWAQAREWYSRTLNIWRDWSRTGVSSAFNQRREQQVLDALAEVDRRIGPQR